MSQRMKTHSYTQTTRALPKQLLLSSFLSPSSPNSVSALLPALSLCHFYSSHSLPVHYRASLPPPCFSSSCVENILRDGGMRVSLFIFLLLSTFLIFPVSVSAFSSYNLTFSPQSVIETFCRDQFFLKSPTQFPKSGALLRKHHCQ